jgi:formylmethanofuran:tetrahydromethanopterin formyltransferase
MKLISKILLLSLTVFSLEAQNIELKSADTARESQLNKQDMSEEQVVKPFYQGKVLSVEHGGAYTYLEVKESTQLSFWVAVTRSDVKIGDYVRFQKELVTNGFKSKALNKTFDELMFASNLQHKVSQ